METHWSDPIVNAFFRQRDNRVLIPRSLALSGGLATAAWSDIKGWEYVVLLAALLSWSSVAANILRNKRERKEREEQDQKKAEQLPLVRWRGALTPMEDLLKALHEVEDYIEEAQELGNTSITIPQTMYSKTISGKEQVSGLLRQLEIPQPKTDNHWSHYLPFLIGLSKVGDEESLDAARNIVK